MKQINNKSKSIRLKLFATLSITVICIIMILMVSNNVILETFYLYNKTRSLKDVYSIVNNYYSKNLNNINMEIELERISINNNFDILIKNQYGTNVYISNRNFLLTLGTMNQIFANSQQIKEQNIIYHNEEITIRKLSDNINGLMFVLLTATLDNDYELYIRMPISSIQESVKISNRLLYFIGGITIIIAGIAISIISKRVTEPIEELNTIAKDMSNLKFNKKYQVKNTDDEIDNLGISINSLSDKLEKTINTLKQTNIELEKDIEEKSKIDEMRKQFISDVSHELKTPIAIIASNVETIENKKDEMVKNQSKWLKNIKSQTERMQYLIKELLNFSSYRTKINKKGTSSSCNLSRTLEKLILSYEELAYEKSITLDYNIQADIHYPCDKEDMNKLFSILIDNAIKYNKKKGYVKISLSEHNKKIEFSIKNSGHGIANENIDKIFDRFYRESYARTQENENSFGLGLSIAKTIVNFYKGDISVKSIIDAETEFEVVLNKK